MGTKQRHGRLLAWLHPEASVGKPHVQVKGAGRIGERAYSIEIRRNRMRHDLVEKGGIQNNFVLEMLCTPVLTVIPKSCLVDEVEALPGEVSECQRRSVRRKGFAA